MLNKSSSWVWGFGFILSPLAFSASLLQIPVSDPERNCLPASVVFSLPPSQLTGLKNALNSQKHSQGSTPVSGLCDCASTAPIYFQSFALPNCESRVLFRSLPGGPLLKIDLNQNPILIQVPAEGGNFESIVGDHGIDLTWPSVAGCQYRLEESLDLSGQWFAIGIYLGMPNQTTVHVPTLQDRNAFYRVSPVCP